MRGRIGWTIVDALASLVAFFLFLVAPGMNRFFAAKVADMIHGTAFKPYVYRALVPTIARGVLAVTPNALEDALRDAATHEPLRTIFEAAGFEAEKAPECIVGSLLAYASLVGFLVVMRSAVRTFYDAPPHVERLAPVGAVLLLPAFFGYASFLYDTTTLMLTALSLVLIATERWRAYLVVFALGVSNKETAVLWLIPFAASQLGRMPWRRLVVLLAAQLAVFGAIRFALQRAFGGNRGEYLIAQWSRHNAEIAHHPPIAKILVCVVLAVLVAWGWRRKPALLRWSALTIVPLVATCAVWGYLDELRAYYDAYPAIALLVIAQRAGVITKSTRRPTESEKYALAD